MVSKYSTIVQWSEEANAFVATVPEFPCLSSFGDTPQEAVEELQGVVDDVLDILEQEGKEPPVPQELRTASGQFRVRMPRSLHRRLVERARIEEVSLNQLVVSILAEGLGRCELKTLGGAVEGPTWQREHTYHSAVTVNQMMPTYFCDARQTVSQWVVTTEPFDYPCSFVPTAQELESDNRVVDLVRERQRRAS